MKQLLIIVIAILLFISLHSCSKIVSNEPPLALLTPYLIDGPWHLISATTYSGTGNISRYNGTNADSVIFGFGPDAYSNVVLTNIFSSIGGTKNQCGYRLKDSTIICSPAWKSGYSDTLFLKSFSDYSLVFQVRNNNLNVDGIEIDSLKKMRFYY